MTALLLGPLLRYADGTCATIWVETDGPCSVEVAGSRARTFCVAGHHYALVVVEGLTPGEQRAYDVRLDGRVVWPEPDSPFPPSVIRPPHPGRSYTFTVGSCRATRPNQPPWTLDKWQSKEAIGSDALRALALRMLRGEPGDWPDAMLFVGDQVYADEVSPQTLEFIRTRRDTSRPPYEQVADFEEYTQLYREAWSDPVVRWFLSTVPTSMIFDDHDVHDDWNTSEVWRRDHQQTSWWEPRIIGALASYWIYQHLGNLAPQAIREEGVLDRLMASGDGWPVLRDLAAAADREADGRKGHRWSYRRDHGGVRLVVVDSRCGRVLGGDHREMVDRDEWGWITEQLTGDVDHLLIASSLPVLLPPGISYLESWDEAVCNSAWGRRFAPIGEKLRQSADLEHWAAFRDSLQGLLEVVAEIGAGRRGRPPASIVFLSGDVHYAYLAEASYPERYGVRSRVLQLVSSPLRNPIQRSIQRADRFARTSLGRRVGWTLARAAGVPALPCDWRVIRGPWFDNNLATLELHGRDLAVSIEYALPSESPDAVLETAWAGELVRAPLPPALNEGLSEGDRAARTPPR